MGARIYIAVPVFNRLRIVEQCLPTLANSTASADFLAIWDDASTEFNPSEALKGLADRLHVTDRNHGIEAQRKAHFTTFLEPAMASYTHLYLTDSDALHDPGWRRKALALQDEHKGAPVCLYNTEAHARMKGNTLVDDPKSNVIWRYYAPGISYLLTRKHVEAIQPWILQLQNWDWDVPRILGHRFAISRESYVDHIGLGGMHHPEKEGADGGDRALNPTDWLVGKRAEIVEALSS